MSGEGVGRADREAVARFLVASRDSEGLDARLADEFDRLTPGQFDVLVAALEGDAADGSEPSSARGEGATAATEPAPESRRTAPSARAAAGIAGWADELRVVLRVGAALGVATLVVAGIALAATVASGGAEAPMADPATPGIEQIVDPIAPPDFDDF
ncbi:hypothetical protein [Agromyces seonyuensis]|uniref:Uncharacterized protein n=1 Tax=Agromyces seonyuensis TaxID=2662446 RepID=A0A6I4NVU3_9MICO|nr:hypothetical protein [Agromyces seonyuensis]MWB97232.1 hypothetical protein [Agromyces seonyuensis]